MNAAPKNRRPGRPKGSNGQAGFRIVPVWNEKFDQAGFAKALLLLAMHLDETEPRPHTRGQNGNTHEEGDHE